MCPARVGPKSNTSPQGCFIRIKLRAHYLFKAEIEENYVIGVSSTCSYSVQSVRIRPILMSMLLYDFLKLTKSVREVEVIEGKIKNLEKVEGLTIRKEVEKEKKRLCIPGHSDRTTVLKCP